MNDAESLRKRIDRALRKPIDIEKLGMCLTITGLALMAILAVTFLAFNGIVVTPWPLGVLIGITGGCLVCGLACATWTVWTRS